MLLKDKIVLVSGIGPGLGVKLAVEAARAGARGVVCAARTQAKLDDAAARIAALNLPCEVLTHATDITDRDQCAGLVAAAIAKFGRIDALANSAYVHGDFSPAAESTLEGWQDAFATNTLGTMKLTQAVVPVMKQQGGGAIVMVITEGVKKPYPGGAGYAASKGALTVAVRYLAKELGPFNIRVNNISMGWMWGAPVQSHMEHAAKTHGISVEQAMAPVVANISLGRMVTDDECARGALLLLSDYASAITGAFVDANGGEVMGAA